MKSKIIYQTTDAMLYRVQPFKFKMIFLAISGGVGYQVYITNEGIYFVSRGEHYWSRFWTGGAGLLWRHLMVKKLREKEAEYVKKYEGMEPKSMLTLDSDNFFVSYGEIRSLKIMKFGFIKNHVSNTKLRAVQMKYEQGQMALYLPKDDIEAIKTSLQGRCPVN